MLKRITTRRNPNKKSSSVVPLPEVMALINRGSMQVALVALRRLAEEMDEVGSGRVVSSEDGLPFTITSAIGE